MKAQGQDTSAAFWSGFVSSGFAAPGSYGEIGGTLVTIVIGGTTSVISGGKFANGAITATYIHLFNAWGGFRKLAGFNKARGKRGTFLDKKNLMVAHEGFILNDGTVLGYFDDSMIRIDIGASKADYSQLLYYDDETLLQAIGNVGSFGQYDALHNNCQDYVSRVTVEYRKLGGTHDQPK